ncbi:DNA/RNA polymerase [Meredithblackwellia eburnea MCA 4105]
MAGSPGSMSAADLLRQSPSLDHQQNSREATSTLSESTTIMAGAATVQRPKFRFSTGITPSPVASTSKSTITIPSPTPVKRESTPSATTIKRVSTPPPDAASKQQPGSVEKKSPASVGKGKGKAVDAEKVRKEYDEQSKSLMNRLSGPSDQKAGLKRDPEEVKRIIYEASKGSAYYINEARKDEELNQKVAHLVSNVERMVVERGGDLSREERLADALLGEIEKRRVLGETVVVVDADAFYASCHELEQPELKGTAFAVGNGVLTTASYEARKYGCRSAMAGFVAKKLCPHLKFVNLDFSLYSRISKQIMEILGQYGPIAPASLDEAYCSLTDYCKTHNLTPEEAAQRMRDHVKRETGCTVSAGVTSNCMMSKIAADLKKPDGQFVVEQTKEAAIDFMRSLPVRRVPGIGRVSERWLQGLGVNTVDDIYTLRGKLFLVKDEINLSFLFKAYLGIGGTVVQSRPRSERKGVGCEQTFATLTKPADMHERLRTIADILADDMKTGQWSGRTLTLTFKLDTYERFTRARTLGKDIYFADADTMYREGKKLLDKEIADRKKALARGIKVKGKKEFSLRLLGLRMGNLRDESERKQGGKSINKTMASSKPSTSRSNSVKPLTSKPQLIKHESNDQHFIDLTFSEDGDGDLNPQESELKVEDDVDDEGSEGAVLDMDDVKDEPDGDVKLPPSSGEAMWAELDGEDADEFLAELAKADFGDGTVDEEGDGSEGEGRHKPFFTGGPSINSKLQVEMPVSDCDRLEFGKSGLECPICGKVFMGSEAAISAHVEEHFGSSQKSEKVRSSSSLASVGEPAKKKAKVSKIKRGGIDSFFGKK